LAIIAAGGGKSVVLAEGGKAKSKMGKQGGEGAFVASASGGGTFRTPEKKKIRGRGGIFLTGRGVFSFWESS